MSVPVALEYNSTPPTVGSGQKVNAQADQNGNLKVAGAGYTSTVSLTRTADTNAYLANDVVGAATGSTAALTFAGIGPTGGGSIVITGSRLMIYVSAIPSGMTSFRLRFYSVTPPSAYGDNAAWDMPSGDRASNLGYIDLGTPVDLGSTLEVEATQINKPIVVPSGGALYAYLVTNGAYTAGSADAFNIVLNSFGV